MIEIKYRTRVFIDRKTKRVTIRVRWSNYETSFTHHPFYEPFALEIADHWRG